MQSDREDNAGNDFGSDTTSDDQVKENWAVVVVHGVGLPEPGATRDAVCDAIARVKRDVRDAPSTAKKAENESNASPNARHLSIDGHNVRVVEAFWGAASEVQLSGWHIIQAIFSMLFGLRALSGAALRGHNWVVRTAAAIPFFLARWIIVPVHLFAAWIAISFLIFVLPLDLTSITPDTPSAATTPTYLTSHDAWFFWTCLSGLGIGLLAIAAALAQFFSYRGWIALDMAIAFTLLATVSLGLTERGGQSLGTNPKAIAQTVATHCVDRIPRESAQCSDGMNCSDTVASLIWGAATTASESGAKLCEIAARNTPVDEVQVKGVGRTLALIDFAGDVALLISVLVSIPLMLLAYHFNYRHPLAHPGRTSFALAICSIVLFIMVLAITLTPVDLEARLIIFSSWGSDGRSAYQFYWYEMGFVAWLIAAIIVGAFAIQQRRKWYASWASQRGTGAATTPVHPGQTSDTASPVTDWKIGDEPHRVLISDYFINYTLISGLAFGATLMTLSLILSYEPPFKSIAGFFAVAILGLSAIAFIFYNRAENIRVGLDLAMDVINHFVAPHRRHPKRREIARIFRQSVDHALTNTDGSNNPQKPNLLIIAHSQGSIITLDALLQKYWDEELQHKVSKLTLLTFGSPYTHIYQRYFPRSYPQIDDTHLETLAHDSRINWTNIFRIDDFIGLHINSKKLDESENFPTNISCHEGGHTNYWADDIFKLKAVSKWLPGRDLKNVSVD
ncbi:MAG: hypothetical protein AAFZ01_11280 [Pseudomonadota bacterium]